MTDTAKPGSESTDLTRRRFLGSAAMAGGIAAATALPVNVRKALASPPSTSGRLTDIKHVVLLMQENRSFDHYFGTLSGVRGFDDPNAPRLPNGRSVLYQPDPDPANPDGYLLPWRADSQTTAAQAIPSTSHAWTVQHQAWNGGAMDNWMPAHEAADGVKAPYVMSYYTRDDVPFHFALANAFTICDTYYCSVLGPTWPNRYMWWAGTIDADGRFGGPCLDTGGVPNGTFSFTTYPERLTKAGISWKMYHAGGGGLTYGVQGLAQYVNAQPGSPLYDQAVAVQPVGQFEYDALNDRLPTVSWIIPGPGDTPRVGEGFPDEHPPDPPAHGATLIASKIDAVAANPEVWAKTAFILTWDENDGGFDHVVPPTPPPGTPGEFVFKTSPHGTEGGGLPTGLGFRVPCIIVSPWTVGGWVCSGLFDHTSQLRFLERITGVVETNITDWRRRTVGDLTAAFRFADGGKPAPSLPDTNSAYNLAQYEAGQLPPPTPPYGHQSVPHQENGHRPRVG